MNTLEKIETEYMLYEIEALPNALEETVEVINVFMKDMNSSISSASKAMRENYSEQQITKIKNFFYSFCGYEEDNISFFDYDTDVLVQHRGLAERYKKYFSRMEEVVTGENFIDVCKLAMYTYDNYQGNYQYLESLRDGISLSVRGITYYGVGEDTQKEFEKFFKAMINNIVCKGKENIKANS